MNKAGAIVGRNPRQTDESERGERRGGMGGAYAAARTVREAAARRGRAAAGTRRLPARPAVITTVRITIAINTIMITIITRYQSTD